MVLERKKRDILFRNFLGGIAWGVGSVVGASLIVGIIGWLLTSLGILSFFSQLIPQK